jgi:hypothetical protein
MMPKLVQPASPAGGVARRGRQPAARCGLGLKPEHFRGILETQPNVGFFEIHAENYMVAGGPLHHYLTQIRSHYPCPSTASACRSAARAARRSAPGSPGGLDRPLRA